MSLYSSDTRLSRQRQITTLKVYNETVEEVVENSEYRVKMKCQTVQLALIVRLPQEFPDLPPVVLCSPALLHPWISAGGRVTGAPGLVNFTTHSDLGMVVAAIRRELEKSPPTFQPNASPVNLDFPQHQLTASTGGEGTLGDPVKRKLAELDKEELQDILEKDGAMDKFLSELTYPPLDTMVDNIASMEENIKATAQNNIELQKQIESYRDSLLNKVQEYHEKKAEMEEHYAVLADMKHQVSGHVLADGLVRLSVSNEEESDKIAESFLSSELTVEDFLQEYIKIRKECHLQKVKADKVKMLQ